MNYEKLQRIKRKTKQKVRRIIIKSWRFLCFFEVLKLHGYTKKKFVELTKNIIKFLQLKKLIFNIKL